MANWLTEVIQRVIKGRDPEDPAIDKLLARDKGGGSSTDPALKPLPDTLEPMEEEDDEVEFIIRHGQLGQLYDAVVSLAKTRKGLYALYDEMEQDTLVGSSLEMEADDASQYSLDKEATVWPEEGKYKEDLEDFFDSIDLENKGWGWIYNIAKYGDFFLQVVGEPGVGITRIIDDYHPDQVYRVEINGKLASFIVAMNKSKAYDDREQYVCEPYHFVHFVNNYKPTFEQVTLSINRRDPKTGKIIEHRKTVTASYGTSTLYNVRQAFRNLKLMEKSMALSRLARAPQIRIFYVNTEGMTPKERQAYIKKLKEQFKRKKSLDKNADFFDSRYNPMSYNDDVFIPITGTVGDVRAETLGGDVDVKAMVDVDYFKDKFFSGIRIPKVFLGFEEAMPGTMGNQTLTTLDVRYARMVKKVQRAFLQGLIRLCQIHLAYKYKKRPVLKQIKLGMVAISSVEEAQRLEVLERRFAVGTTMAQLIRDLEGQVNPAVITKYIFENILKLTGIDLKALYKVPKPPPGEEEEGGFGASTTPPPESEMLLDTLSQETFYTDVKGEKAEEIKEIMHRIDEVIHTLVGRIKRLRDVITSDDFPKNRDTEAPLPTSR